MTTPASFTKEPAETFTIGVEYSGKLPSGASLVSGTVAAVDEESKQVDNTVLASTTATIVGTQAKVRVQAGSHGKKYRIVFTSTITGSEVLEDSVRMEVIDSDKL